MAQLDQQFAATQAPPSLTRTAVTSWWNTDFAMALKRRRVEAVGRILGLDFFDGSSLDICDLGCGSGKDFVRHLKDTPHRLTGVDLVEVGLRQANFRLVCGDAATIPAPDQSFDLLVSFGVLEHIEPIEHLCEVISEIRRVAKRFAVVVPCIATPLEPHVLKFRWPLAPATERIDVNYFSDQAWLKFKGFLDARTHRIDYVPGLIKNLVITG